MLVVMSGHGWLIMLVETAGQALPPFAAAVTIVRTICWTPPPHIAEH